MTLAMPPAMPGDGPVMRARQRRPPRHRNLAAALRPLGWWSANAHRTHPVWEAVDAGYRNEDGEDEPGDFLDAHFGRMEIRPTVGELMEAGPDGLAWSPEGHLIAYVDAKGRWRKPAERMSRPVGPAANDNTDARLDTLGLPAGPPCRVVTVPMRGEVTAQPVWYRQHRAVAAESRALPHPPIKVGPPGVARWRCRPGDLFMAGKVNATGQHPMAVPQDEPGWVIPPEAVAVFQIAAEAATMADVGRAYGYKGKHAERMGKKILLEAAKKCVPQV